MRYLTNLLLDLVRGQEAPTFLEYGLLVIVIALVVVTAAAFFGSSVAQMFQDVAAAN